MTVGITGESIKKERSIARDLRKSAWWKRKCAAGVCYYCNSRMPAKMLTMDHIVPVARGGKSVKSNIVTSCKECNTKKKYMLPIEWDEYIKRI